MTDYVLLGGGAFAREIHDWFAPGQSGWSHRFAGYLNDGPHLPEMAARGLDLLGDTQTFKPRAGQKLIMAVGEPKDKLSLAQRRADPSLFETLIHPLASVSSTARLGAGAVVGPFCYVSSDAAADAFLTLNAHSSLGHDVRVGRYTTLSCYVDLTGWVEVGSACFFGSGARVVPKIKIGNNCRIGAGAVIMRNVGDNVTLYTPPARRL